MLLLEGNQEVRPVFDTGFNGVHLVEPALVQYTNVVCNAEGEVVGISHGHHGLAGNGVVPQYAVEAPFAKLVAGFAIGLEEGRPVGEALERAVSGGGWERAEDE